MPKVTEYTNEFGQELIMITNDDGSSWSGLKAAYEATLAANSAPTA